MSTQQKIPIRSGLDILGLSCLLVLVLPLLPLLYEVFFSHSHDVSVDSVWLAAAMYVIGLGLASKLRTYFGLSLLAAFFATACYGYAAASLGKVDSQGFTKNFAWGIIGFAALVHFAERFYRHVILREQFFEWER